MHRQMDRLAVVVAIDCDQTLAGDKPFPGRCSGSSEPIGSIKMWPTNTPPDGWLLCYGQLISRETYADLFGVISTTFGVGDGSTTFNLPDFRGRVPLGQDDMGGSSADRVTNAQADDIGGAAGDEAALAAHTHTYAGAAHVVIYTASGNLIGTSLFYSAEQRTTGSTGTDDSMPPYLTVNYIIKT